MVWGGQCGRNGPTGICSFHAINSSTASRTATVCESPFPQAAYVDYTDKVNGLPVAAGIACTESEKYSGTPPSVKLLAVDWAGHETTFLTPDSSGNIPYGNCSLSPAGAQMACTANASGNLTLIAPGVVPHDLGRRYNVLGWIDDTHIAVHIDDATLGVLSIDTRAVVNIALSGAYKMQMSATLTGAFKPTGAVAHAGPLLYLNTEAGPDLLMNADGTQTGVLSASRPYVRSQFGDRLFGILNYGASLPGDPTVVAINPDGSWTELGPPKPKNEFVDAIGSQDGTTWALVTVRHDCSSRSRAALGLGSAAGVRTLAVLPAVNAQWTLRSYNRAGIVLEAATCTLGSTVIATEIVDRLTGQVSDLAQRLGAGCSFVAASDAGAFLCYSKVGPLASLVLVEPDGSRRHYSFPVGAALCNGRETGFGISWPGVLSNDGRYITASYTCMAPGDNGGRDQLLIIATASGAVIEGPKTLYLDGVRWLPDDRLVASQGRLGGKWLGGTWIVSTDGNVQVISTAGTAQEAA